MATTSKTIYTHACDLCGAETPRADLRRLGSIPVSEGNGPVLIKPTVDGKLCDVCPACRERPIADLLAVLEPSQDAELAGLRGRHNSR